MAKSIKALYEDGVFKPLDKVRLKNRQRVKLTVVESEKPSKRLYKSTAKHRPASSRVMLLLILLIGSWRCLRVASMIFPLVMTTTSIGKELSLESLSGYRCISCPG